MKANSTEIFKNASVPKAVFVNAIPSIISMIMVLIYNLADTFFIGKTNNGYMVNAISLVTPAYMVFMALGMLFGIGGTSFVARKLGEGNTEIAKKVSSFCFWVGLAVGIVGMAIVLIFAEPLCVMIGAKENDLAFTKSYFSIVSLSLPFLIVSNAFSNIIRAEGKANVAMMGMIIGNVTNIILDPIMILGFNWGIEGAAIATVIGNVVACVFYIIHIVSKRSIFSISPKYFTAKEGISANVFKIGLPASLNNVLMSASNIVLNNFIGEINEFAVGGLGVALKVNMITLMLLIGLATGVQPLLGYCFGAKNVKRFSAVLKFTLLCAVVMSVIMSIVSFALSTTLVRSFISTPDQVEFGTLFVKILVASGPVLGVLFVFINALQAMGAGIPSLILSASRQGIVYLPILIVVNVLFHSVNLLVAVQPITDYIATILAGVLFMVTFNKFKKQVALKNDEPNQELETNLESESTKNV